MSDVYELVLIGRFGVLPSLWGNKGRGHRRRRGPLGEALDNNSSAENSLRGPLMLRVFVQLSKVPFDSEEAAAPLCEAVLLSETHSHPQNDKGRVRHAISQGLNKKSKHSL